jgi:hypothetical protein
LLTVLATLVAALAVANYEMAAVAGVTLTGIVYLLFNFKFKVLMLICKLPILLLSIMAGVHYLFYPGLLLLTIILTRLYYKKRFKIVYPKLS